MAEALHRLEMWLGQPAREKRFVRWILGLGLVLRLAWLFANVEERLRPHKSEMWHVTAHWAQTGTMADAYYPGSGISSHVGPVNTVIAGTIYRLFGTGTPTSEFLLSVLSSLVALTLFWFLYRAMEELRISVVPRLATLAFLSILPLNFYLETVDFRVREGALAAMLMAAMLWWLLRIDRLGKLDWRTLWLFGLLAGFAFLVNPGVALGGYAGLALVGLRHMPVRRWPGGTVLLLVAALAINGAWIVRNEILYDRFMPSRGNFGLELATANHPAAIDPPDERAAFRRRMADVHPFFRGQGKIDYQHYARDIDYFDKIGADAKIWIRENPADFAGLTLHHLRQLWFPSTWLYDQYSDARISPFNRLLQVFTWATAAAALLMLLIGLVESTRRYLFLVVVLLPPVLLYSIVQPTLRYRYLILSLVLYLAAAFLWRLLRWDFRRGTPAARLLPDPAP